jgi:hypothetical protein
MVASVRALWTRIRRFDPGTTPAKLRTLLFATVIASLVLSIVSWASMSARQAAIEDVGRGADRLILVQQIKVAVLRADSIASASYLIGGQERSDQRTAYLAEVDAAALGLTAASRNADPADVAALQSAASMLASYVGLIEQARANNRQGFPVGAAYQRQASQLVSYVGPASGAPADIVGVLSTVESRDRARVNDAIERAHRSGWWLHIVGWPTLLLFAFTSLWMAKRFRRLVNVPLVAGAAALTISLAVSGFVAAQAVFAADDAIASPLSDADQLAAARAAAFEARSQESLTLISRGSGQPNEQRWLDASATALNLLTDECAPPQQFCLLRTQFGIYASQHELLRSMDDGGDWEAAVASALSTEGGTAGGDFASFDEASAQALRTSVSDTSRDIDHAVDGLPGSRMIASLGAFLAAVLAAIGISQRLREYR